jgi:site-specific recombinase XerD
MTRMKPTHVPEAPHAVLTEEQLRRLLKVCEGKGLLAKRDSALLHLLLDTGMWRAELSILRVEDIDFEQNIALVVGMGRRPRGCPFGRRTAGELDRYLRERAKHRDADRPDLWLGMAGPLTPKGVHQLVRDRARQASLGKVWPHIFRHSYAHQWLAIGSCLLLKPCAVPQLYKVLAELGIPPAAGRAH